MCYIYIYICILSVRVRGFPGGYLLRKSVKSTCVALRLPLGSPAEPHPTLGARVRAQVRGPAAELALLAVKKKKAVLPGGFEFGFGVWGLGGS